MTDPNKDLAKDSEASDGTDIDWAAAMAEQTAHTSSQTTQADGLAQEVDDWASALAEQTAATPSFAPAAPAAAAPAAAPPAPPAMCFNP